MQTRNIQALIDALPDAVVILNGRAQIVAAGSQIEALVGWTGAELAGNSFETLFSSSQNEVAAAHLAAFLAGPASALRPRHELQMLRQDGTEVPVELVLSSFACDEERFVCAILRDLTERRHSEAVAHRVTTVLESITDAAFTVDRDWRFLHLNQQAEQLIHRSGAELLGRSLWEEFPGVRGTAFEQFYRHAVTHRESVHFEEYSPLLDLWFEVHAYPSDEGLSVYFRDINERKQAELALRRSERNYRLLMEEASDAIMIADAERRWVAVNPQACALLGYTEEELLSMRVEELVAPEELADAQLQLTALRHHQRVCGERLLLRKDGERIPAEISARIMPDGRFQAIVRDITVRKEAEAALRRSEERFRRLTESNILGIFFWDGEGVITYANEALLETIGYTQADLAAGGLSWSQLSAPEHSALDREKREQLVRTGLVAPFERELLRKDGTRVPALVGAARWQGSTEGGISFVLDLTAQKEVEMALRRSREWQEFAQLAAGFGAWEADLSTGDLEWSEALYQLLGLPPDTVAAYETWIERVHPDDRELIERSFQQLLPGEPCKMEYRVFRADGELRWHYGVVVYHSGSSGQERRIVGMTMDITERKAAEAALRESEERYRSLVDNATDLIYSHDLNGRFLSMNRAGEAITGYTQEQFLQRSLLDLVAPEYWDLLRARADDRFRDANLTRTSCELEIITQSGERVPLEISSVPMLRNGKVVALQGIARDITERRQAEAALHASEERFRVICEASPIGVFLCNPQGAAIYTNPTMQEYLRLPPEAALGYGWHQAVHPEELPSIMATWELSVRERQGFEGTYRLQRHDHTQAQLIVRVAPVWQGEALLGFVGSAVDTTERAHLEEQLRQAQKMEAIGRLAGGVAHDFNNMLAVINGYSDLALSRLPEDHPVARYLAEVSKAGERAAALTRQLLAFSRKQLLKPERIELGRILAELQPMLSRLIEENILLETDLGSDTWVNADPGQLEQVILNLVVNARDAMPRGGRLVLSTRSIRPGVPGADAGDSDPIRASVLLEVRDTGSGMTPEVQARIFEPFYTTKEPGQGTGLGLATVYGIVTQSGGHVEVESTPGAGSTFRIYLPQAAPPAEAMPTPDTATEIPRGMETILLVEDEEMVRTLVRTVLEGCGYRVLEATSPEEIARVQAEYGSEIALLLTDVVMPQISGPEVAERLRAEYPKLKVLYMSGYTDDAVVRHGLRTAEVAFIQKPFSPLALAQKVRDLLN